MEIRKTQGGLRTNISDNLIEIGLGQVKTNLKNQVSAKEWEQFITLEHEEATGLFCDVIAKRVLIFCYLKDKAVGEELARNCTLQRLC